MNDLAALGEQLKRRDISSSDFVNAESLVSINEGVRMFNISSDGGVSSTSDLVPLHIVKLKNESQAGQSSEEKECPAFLHVGDWIYPLVPGVSPVLYSHYGAYIFPDVMALTENKYVQRFVALMLPESVPSETKQLFQDIIRSLTLLLEQLQDYISSFMTSEAVSTAQEMSHQKLHLKTLSPAADKLAQGLSDAVARIADEVEKGAKTVKEKVTEESIKIQHKHKHTTEPKLREGIMYANDVADATVKVSGFVVNKLADIVTDLGKEMAAHARLDPKVPHPGTSNVDEAGGSTGAGRDPIYAGLEEAAMTLDRCLKMKENNKYKSGENPV